MDEQQALITLDIILNFSTFHDRDQMGINRLFKEIPILYEKGNIKFIKDIYNKEGFNHYINKYNNYSLSINKGIIFFIFNTEPILFILQFNKGHPFTPSYSYLYKPLIYTKSYIYKVLMLYLKYTHEDIVIYILSFIPNYILLHTKMYALKNNYLNEANNIDDIESGRLWAPTHHVSALPNILYKYLNILNNMNIKLKT